MKREYKIGEDFLLASATFLIAAAIIMKVLGVSWNVGLTTITPRNIAFASVICLLFNIALNIQELTRKPR